MHLSYVLLVVCLLACVAGIGGSCSNYDQITLQVHDPYSRVQFSGYIAAQKQSYFSDQCLNATILYRDADSVVRAVLSNSAQFGTNFVPAILDDDAGTSVVIISQLFQRSGFRIVWPASSNIKGCDLRGQSIGRVDALGLPLQAQLLSCDSTADLDSFVFIQNPDVSSPMKWDVDAMSALSYKEYAELLTSVSPNTMKLVSASDFVTYEDFQYSLLEDAVFVSRAWLANASNYDIAKRFLAASFKGWIYCRDNEQTCASYGSASNDALRLYEMREVNRLIWPSPLGIGTMNQTAFMHTAQIMQGLNFARNYTSPLPYSNAVVGEALLSLISIDTGAIDYNESSFRFCPSGASYILCADSVPTGKGGPMSLTTIIAIVIPVSVIIAIGAAVGLFLLWRRKALVRTFSDDPNGGTGYQINIKELKIEAKIGSGSFGDVYKGTWRDTPVAIKRLRSNVLNEQLAELNREAAIMLQLRHPHIVLFMGCCSKLPDVCIVTEFMPKGSLFDVLHDERVDLPWDRRLSMAKDTAKGIAFLHGSDPPTLHNDLKSSNLLVNHNWLCKVSDFGLTSLKGSRTQDELLGSLFWMAPEVLNNEQATEKSDVYSFGIILWELAARAEPYENMSWAAVRVGVLKRKQRPSIPKNLYEKYHDYVDLIKECWEQDPARRPSFPTILKRLEQISYRLSLQITTHPPPTSGKVSIVFSDIQNSAFLWEHCPTEMKDAMSIHNDIIRDAFREFGGYEVRSDGDSFMIAFSSAKDACSFSVKVTETLLQTQWNPELMAWLEDEGKMTSEEGYEDIVFKGVRVRMGMHHDVCEFTRDLVTDRVDYTGPTAIKAARLSLTAPGGQILVSDSFHNEILRDLHTISNPPPELLPVGTIYLKGFADPEMVYQLLAPSLVGRHKKYMAQPANNSAIIWQDQMNSLDSMFSGHNITSTNNRTLRNVTLTAYPQDLARPNSCPPARFTTSQTPPPARAHPSNRGPNLNSSPSPGARPTTTPSPAPNSRGALPPHPQNPHAVPSPPLDPLPLPNHTSSPKTSGGTTASLSPKLPRNSGPSPPSPTLTPATLTPGNTPGRGKTPRNIEENTFTIDFNEITLGDEIGRGSYGLVLKGKWRGQQVAVKRLLRGKIKQELLTEFYNEVQIMCNLRCPHLILFMGACFKPPNLCIVTELMPRNLYQVLHDSRITITGWMRLRWSKQIAMGMNYLHKLNLIHRDLKSNNLLVDSSYNVKITDFGFARVKTTNQTMTKCGTVNWIAPEIAEGNTYTEKSDVYSYAITLYEILTRKVPFGNESANGVLEKVLEGKRPEIPANSPPKFVQLITTCWEQDYHKRPSFEEVLNMLDAWSDSDCE